MQRSNKFLRQVNRNRNCFCVNTRVGLQIKGNSSPGLFRAYVRSVGQSRVYQNFQLVGFTKFSLVCCSARARRTREFC